MIEKIKKLFANPGKTVDPAETAQTETAGIQTPYGKKLSISEEEKTALIGSLTKRERDTFLLLLEGYTLKETADRLGIGYPTANTHQTTIYRKLHVNSRAELIINYHNSGEFKSFESTNKKQ